MTIDESTPPHAPDVVILSLTGRLDAESVDAFGARLEKGIESGKRRIVLNLSGLEYVNSVGLRALVVGAKLVAARNGHMVLCHPQPRIQQLFETVGFESMLRIASSEEQAVEWARSEGHR